MEKKTFCTKCNKSRKFKRFKTYVLKKTFLSIICEKCDSNDDIIFKEEESIKTSFSFSS